MLSDAKAVKEVAIANAKAALEEAFTPHLKDMLAQKINEIEEIDEVEEISEESRKERAKVDKYEYEKGKLKGQNKFDKEVSTKIDENDEMDEELNLDEFDQVLFNFHKGFYRRKLLFEDGTPKYFLNVYRPC